MTSRFDPARHRQFASRDGRSLLLATTNPGKLREARQILCDLPIHILNLGDFLWGPQPPEDQPTFEGNACFKALYYAGLTGAWTIADDSGLEVDALNGEPGVRSARYAGDEADDAANNAKLINRLASVPVEKRTARFRCVVALATPAKVLVVTSGTLEGLIVDQPRGANGFGYDPYFFVPDIGMTTAEMSPDQKNRISHRGQAMSALKETLRHLLLSSEPGEETPISRK